MASLNLNLRSVDGDGDGYSSPVETTETTSSSSSALQLSEVTVNSAPSSYTPASLNPASTTNHIAHSAQRGPRSMRRGSHGHGPGQGRGYQEGNRHRNYNSNANMQPRRGGHRGGGYIQPSPFIHPPMPRPVGPFGNNALYIDGASGMIYLLVPPNPPLFPTSIYIPVPYHLLDEIKRQIDFYFSVDNLVKDIYLRLHMDEQGWVHVNLIADFKRVSCLTNNVQLILYVMQTSNVVEVQGDTLRRRDDWFRWLLPSGVQHPLGSQPQNVGLDEGRQLRPGGGDRPPLA